MPTFMVIARYRRVMRTVRCYRLSGRDRSPPVITDDTFSAYVRFLEMSRFG
jgi:hypothetical protein